MKTIIYASLLAMTTALAICGEPLKIGDHAPAVSAVDDDGREIAFDKIYEKQRYTLVYFYPMSACENLCTLQGRSIQGALAELTGKGVAVVGVSHDDVVAQKRFKEKNGFTFTLIADKNQAISKAFGVRNIMNTQLNARQAFLIEKGKIVWGDVGKSASQADDVLKAISMLNSR